MSKKTLLVVGMLVAMLPALSLGFTVSFGTDQFTVEDSYGYQVFSYDQASGLPSDIGAPGVPLAYCSISIPSGMKVSEIVVTNVEQVELPGTYNLLPVQQPRPISMMDEPVFLTKPDIKYYGQNKLYPDNPVVSYYSGNESGFGIASLAIAPLQYNPVTGKVYLNKNIDFELNYEPYGPDIVLPKVRTITSEETVRDMIKGMVINPEDVGYSGATLVDTTNGNFTSQDPMNPLAPPSTYDYLFIYKDGWDVTPVVWWHNVKGVYGYNMPLSEVYANYTGVDDMEKIRNCIIDQHVNHGVIYVALGGMLTDIGFRDAYDPNWEVEEGDHMIPTQLYYECLDGNWNADGDGYWGEYPSDNCDYLHDVFVGRYPYTASDISYINDKVLCYEDSDWSSLVNPGDYQDEALFMAGYLDASTDCSVVKDYIDTNYVPTSFPVTKLYEKTGNMTSANCIAELNEGKNFVNHIMHANQTLLGMQDDTPGVTSTQLFNLTNSPRFSGAFYTIGCYASRPETSNNCGAEFVQSHNGGGIGFVGNSRYGWYYVGSPMNASNAFDVQYWKYYFQNGYHHAVAPYVCSREYFVGSIADDLTRYIFCELYLQGDPETSINCGGLNNMALTYNGNIYTGSQSYTVTVNSGKGPIQGALVCVWKPATEVYAYDETNSSGQVTFTINPTTPGTMYLTVTYSGYFTNDELPVTVTQGTDISLRYFAGKAIDKGIVLGWEVNADEPFSGFNLYRREVNATKSNAGEDVIAKSLNEFTKVNQTLITGDNPYRYVDATAQDGVKYEYKLEVVKSSEPATLGNTMVDGGSGLPTTFSLSQSYPNPAVDTATVEYTIPESAGIVKVNLQVYDLTGRLVKTLVSSEQGAGEYRVSFDLAGDSGEKLGSGVYIYSLDAGSYHASSKMVVTR